MNFYFDDADKVNLHVIPYINEVRPYHQLKYYYETGEAVFCNTTNYNQKGIYLIEVSKLTHQWTNKNQYACSFNIFDNLPQHVVDAVNEGFLRIVILSVVEGDNFVKPFWDGFRHLTSSIKKLNFPPMSVLIISANLKANQEYKVWCEENDEQPLFEIIGAVEGFAKEILNEDICVKHIDIENCFLFNSLNRAHRQSRTEHLFFLAEKNILNLGLISGGTYFNEQKIHEPLFVNVDEKHYYKVLQENYPKSIDLTLDNHRIGSLANTVNLNIYYKSMLSIVTETYFHEPGLYFSEKIFKPICVGSPQIVLGQQGYIDYFKSKFNLHLDFDGLDTSFDLIDDPRDRFNSFHSSLLEWTNFSRDKQKKLFYSWFNQLESNLKTVKTINFKRLIINDIIKSTKEYFLKN